MTIVNPSYEIHGALRAREAYHGGSSAAEIRDILESAVRPSGRVRLGSLIVASGRGAEMKNSDFEVLQ